MDQRKLPRRVNRSWINQHETVNKQFLDTSKLLHLLKVSKFEAIFMPFTFHLLLQLLSNFLQWKTLQNCLILLIFLGEQLKLCQRVVDIVIKLRSNTIFFRLRLFPHMLTEFGCMEKNVASLLVLQHKTRSLRDMKSGVRQLRDGFGGLNSRKFAKQTNVCKSG